MSNQQVARIQQAVENEGDALRPDVDRASRFLADHGFQTVRVEWCDLHGLSRGKRMTRGNFLEAIEAGTPFSSAALFMDLEGTAYPPASQAAPDSWVNIHAMLDLDTLQPYVIEPGSARCLADLRTSDGRTAVPQCPRTALKRVVRKGREMGLETSVRLELEFYLLPGIIDGRLPVGKHVYRMQSSREESQFLDPLHRQLALAGIAVEAVCAEDGPGQFEIILHRGPPVAVADAAHTARTLVKEMASRHGLVATFLSKPLAGCSGSGAHIHQSLWTPDGDPLFGHDQADGRVTFWQYLAGQLRYFKEASAFYLPTINSYKRLALRQPEPLTISWAYEARNVAIRVLSSRTGCLHIENRAVAGEANPYLSIAASLACGFEGVRTDEDIPSLNSDPAPARPPLPHSLQEAIAALDTSEVLRRWLGPELVDTFIALKRSEIERFETAITDWELKEYVTVL